MEQKIYRGALLLSPKFLKQKEFWKRKFAQKIDTAKITFVGEPSRQTNKETIDIIFPGNVSRLLIKLVKQSDLSIYIMLLAGLKALIYRYTGSEDIIVISPVYRPHVSGDTINRQLFIRDSFNGEITFKQLILAVKESLLQAYKTRITPSKC